MRILAGVDEFPGSENTVRAAVEVALAMDAIPYFVHAVPMARHAAYEMLDSGDSLEVALSKIDGEFTRRLADWCEGVGMEPPEVNLEVAACGHAEPCGGEYPGRGPSGV